MKIPGLPLILLLATLLAGVSALPPVPCPSCGKPVGGVELSYRVPCEAIRKCTGGYPEHGGRCNNPAFAVRYRCRPCCKDVPGQQNCGHIHQDACGCGVRPDSP
ncbi:hypothetical protein PTTG_26781 [Puccinia triticina 1-1 BBBD Race 1]|uniref:TNFR-Cys domain-containing protein n=1 Tax=Puccinia triticina (isolate 1-1 / race 1 (BBBD)) TaxID=630390 RepID=A0A180GRG7_PUCT1|nr:hypothetical protein PTTG_26781 [Puccinia triticina 1-1 BBBD Race 1]